MKKIFSVLLLSSVFAVSTVSARSIKQTICFSKVKQSESLIDSFADIYKNPALKRMSTCQLPSKLTSGSIGDSSTLCSGQCQGKTLPQMNKAGWKLIHVIEGLEGAFGMVFEK